MQTIAGEIPIEHDESTDTYRLSYDWWRDQTVTSAIVMAVSTITNTSPTDMEPIRRVVDPDALNDLFSPRDDAQLRRATGSASFRFYGCDIIVYATGEIEIRPLDDPEDPAEEDCAESDSPKGNSTESSSIEGNSTESVFK